MKKLVQLNYFLIYFIFSLVSCVQDPEITELEFENTTTEDGIEQVLVTDFKETADEFKAVRDLLNNKCLSCHSSSSLNFNFDSQEKFVTRGFVKPGSLKDSPLYYRLIGAKLGVASENMPPSQFITDKERELISSWILNLGKNSTLNIYEIDFSISSEQQTIDEDQGEITLTLNLSKVVDQDLIIPILPSGDAILGIDYTLSDSKIIIPAGRNKGAISLKIIDDEDFEPLEKINFNLSQSNLPKDLAFQLVNQDIELSIKDNDVEIINYNVSCNNRNTSLDLKEGTDNIKFEILLDKIATSDVQVSFGILSSLISGLDYNVASQILTIPAGQQNAMVEIMIIDDEKVESVTPLQVSCKPDVVPIAKYTLNISSTPLIYSISDNDVAPPPPPVPFSNKDITISISNSDLNISEDLGKLVLTATLDSAAPNEVKIPIGLAGDVINGVDYKIDSNILTIGAGQVSGIFEIEMLDDLIVEPNEALKIVIGEYKDDLAKTIYSPLVKEINKIIVDNDKSIKLSIANISASGVSEGKVLENSGSFDIIAELPEVLGIDIILPLGVSGTAQLGVDFNLSASQILIPAGSLKGMSTVSLVNDMFEEPSEVISISIGNFKDVANYTEVKPNTMVLNIEITDDDLMPLEANFGGVKTILDKSCTNCHSHKADGAYPIDTSSEENLKKSEYLVLGDANASKLYFKIRGAGVVDSSLETMPKGGGDIPKEYLGVLKTWINSFSDIETPMVCDDSSFKNGLEYNMRRLSNIEISNTIEAAFGAESFMKLKPNLNFIPVDPVPHLEDFQAGLMFGQIEAMGKVSMGMLETAQGDPELLADLFGPCALVSPSSELCFEHSVSSLGKKLYRRPLLMDEFLDLNNLIKDPSVVNSIDKYYLSFLKMLQSPNFLLLFDKEKEQNFLDRHPLEQLGLSLDQLVLPLIDTYDSSLTGPMEFRNVHLLDNALTVMATIKPSKLDNGGTPQFRMISQSEGSASNQHIFMLGADGTSGGEGRKLRIRLSLCESKGVNCSTETFVSNGEYLNVGQESKIIFTYDSKDLKVYHNGVLVPMDNAVGAVRKILNSKPEIGTFIGSNFNNYMPFNGQINNVLVFNRVISNAEFVEYNKGTFLTDLKNKLANRSLASSIKDKNIQSIDGESLLSRSQFEIASFVSYTLTGSPPDELLYNAAMAGELSTPISIRSHSRRLLNSPKGRENIKNFINNWLELFGVTTSSYSDLFLNGIEGSNLMDTALEELMEHGMKSIVDDQVNFLDLMSSNQVHINSKTVSSLYGLDTFNPSGTTVVDFSRAGILAAPGLNITGGYFGSPVKRGVRIRKRVLCDKLLSPSVADIEERDNLEPKRFDHSNREYWRLFTETNAVCLSCHASTNPLGNAFEHIDSIGRTRVTEDLYSEDGSAIVASFGIVDTKTKPYLTELDTVEVAHAGELGVLIGNSEKAKACFVEQAAQFSLKRKLSGVDQCYLNEMQEKFIKGETSILDVFVSLVETKYLLKKIK